MVSRNKSKTNRLKKFVDNLNVYFEPVSLQEDDDNERIKRLSRQILACIDRTKKERRRKKEQQDEIFSRDFDAIFGLEGVPV
jgi:hypothetical protein